MRLALAIAVAAAAVPTSSGRAASSPYAPADTTRTQERPVSITVDRENGHAPVVRIGPILADRELESAAASGLPIRVRIRVELWKDRWFDELIATSNQAIIVVHEPIGNQYFVRSMPARSGSVRSASFADVRHVVETEFRPPIRPPGRGRFYYTVSLQIETLSVSDLEELERWLQGELQPAVSGDRSIAGAVGQGAKRLMLRVLDLPERRYDARTGRFTVN